MPPEMAIFGIVLCAGASFFFALSESALFSLGPWQARGLVEGGGGRGQQLGKVLADPQDVLATIVLGNTFANGGVLALGLSMAFNGHWPLGWTLAALGSLILVFCEVVPKTLGVRSAGAWALRVAAPMGFLSWITRPLRRVAQAITSAMLGSWLRRRIPQQTGVTDEEYQELVELAFQQGTLASTEKEMISQIIRLDKRTARDVMSPRLQMACISDDLSVEQMIEAARRFGHRRLPIYDETPDTIVGVLNTQLLLMDPELDLSEVIEFPSFVPASMNLLQLLRSLQRQQRGMAIVLDEYGGTAGVVTIEDILEDLVGEIRSEGENEAALIERLDAGRWRLSGLTRLEDFRKEYPGLEWRPGVETVGGFLTRELGVVPVAGQKLQLKGLTLTAHAVDERRVREVLVELDSAARARAAEVRRKTRV